MLCTNVRGPSPKDGVDKYTDVLYWIQSGCACTTCYMTKDTGKGEARLATWRVQSSAASARVGTQASRCPARESKETTAEGVGEKCSHSTPITEGANATRTTYRCPRAPTRSAADGVMGDQDRKPSGPYSQSRALAEKVDVRLGRSSCIAVQNRQHRHPV